MLESKKLSDLLNWALIVVSLVVVNQLNQFFFFRVDLTEEKRYTLSDPTKTLLEELEEPLLVEVYLDGKLPAGFIRLQKAIAQTLDQFEAYAPGKIKVRFTDPTQAVSETARNKFIYQIAEKGIQPTNVTTREEGERIEKLILPGAVIQYEGKEKGVMLFKGNKGAPPEERLNQSVENIEFELANAIRALTRVNKKKIGWVLGHGELDSLEAASITNSILEYYELYKIQLPEKENLENYDALIIAKPQQPFSLYELVLLDQFLMKGGKLVVLMDKMAINMDSVSGEGTLAIPYETGLEDPLFRYGIRVNMDLIQDLYCGTYPVVAGSMGNQPQIRMLPWPYFPLVNTFAPHPITRNLDAVLLRFCSSLDTIQQEGVRKTPLLFTSEYSRIMEPPVQVAMNQLQQEMKPEFFPVKHVPAAFLLEGQFTSAYKNRILPPGFDPKEILETSKQTALLVVSDGDLVRNDLDIKKGQPLPLGFDQFSQITYANTEFFMHALSYLVDDSGIITSRNKEIRLRPLDKVAIKQDQVFWQLLNLVVPVALVFIFGFAQFYWRKRRYEK